MNRVYNFGNTAMMNPNQSGIPNRTPMSTQKVEVSMKTSGTHNPNFPVMRMNLLIIHNRL